MRPFAIAMFLTVAQPGLTAPVADSYEAAMSARLFPAMSAVKADRLPADTRRMLNARRARIKACPQQDADCILRASLWTDGETMAIAQAAARSIAAKSDRPAIADDGAEAQIKRELAGLNSVLDVYGLGQAPRNPKIDGPLDQAASIAFSKRVSAAVAISQVGSDAQRETDPSITLALSLLDVNDRDEAVAFEPLDDKHNAAPQAYAGSVDWSKFKYTAIIVLGNGPELDNEALSPRAKLRVKLAVARFSENVAPFIIVSGGAVHPRGTKFNEAVEMRKALVERYAIPADRIILEPYARYTATNLRNATRRLNAVGAPLKKPAIILTDAEHSLNIERPEFSAKSISQIGYVPGRVGPRISASELAFLPSIASLRVDPSDPLDP